MNLCQALTSAMDITMERDSAAGDYLCTVYLHTVLVNNKHNLSLWSVDTVLTFCYLLI